MIPINTNDGEYNIDIELLDWDNSWVDTNGRMLFHLVNDYGNHIEGYYFMGIDDRGIRLIPFGTRILDVNNQLCLIIDGVDIV
jgi:hypothetical protein